MTTSGLRYNIVRIKDLKHFWVINPKLSYIDAFKKLKAKDMMFVLLYTDPGSPFIYLKRDSKSLGKELHDSDYRKAIVKSLKYTSAESSKASKIIKSEYASVESAIQVAKSMMPFNYDEMEALEAYMKNYLEEISKKPTDINDLKKISDVVKTPTYDAIKAKYFTMLEASKDQYEDYLEWSLTKSVVGSEKEDSTSSLSKTDDEW